MNAVGVFIPPDEQMHEACGVFLVLPDLVAQCSWLIVSDVGDKFMYGRQALVESLRPNFVSRQFVDL
jgi:hypothetical protein